jgi:hypothetical protein
MVELNEGMSEGREANPIEIKGKRGHDTQDDRKRKKSLLTSRSLAGCLLIRKPISAQPLAGFAQKVVFAQKVFGQM